MSQTSQKRKRCDSIDSTVRIVTSFQKPDMFSRVKEQLEYRRTEAKEDVERQLKVIREMNNRVECTHDNPMVCYLCQCIQNQKEVEHLSDKVHEEVQRLKENSEKWTKTISRLNQALKKFGDLESFFDEASERLENLVDCLKNPKP